MPTICLITGPAGVGKSSVAKYLADQIARSAYVNVDYLREMVMGGYVLPWPSSEEATIQTRLGAENACAMAKNFLSNGFSVFIDDVIGENLFNLYRQILGPELRVFLLLPSKTTLLERFDNRGNDKELRARTEELYDKFVSRKDKLSWEVIDTSKQSLKETGDEILRKLLPGGETAGT